MSDASPSSNGAAPAKARKAADEGAAKIAAEARSFAADADAAREKLVATAIHRAKARREIARRWTLERAEEAGTAVQARPATAIGFALGLGVIIGLLLAG